MNTSHAPKTGSVQANEATKREFIKLLEYAILSPSGHNTQPWLFRLVDDYLDVVADRTRSLPVVDPYDRELTISCGAALDHLAVAAYHYGRDLTIDICPDMHDMDLLARVKLGDEVIPSVYDHDKFEAITKRRTTRSMFEDKNLPESLSAHCIELANKFNVELMLITDSAMRANVADLVAEGDKIQFADPRFRRELGSWVHSRRADSRDGMSGEGFGMPDVLSSLGGLIIRTFDLGKGLAAKDVEKIVNGTPTLAVFICQRDTPPNWVATGRALSEVLLTLTTAGATASYLNPPIEVEHLRARLKDLLGCKGEPQLLMRFGYGPITPTTVRRDVNDVLVQW